MIEDGFYLRTSSKAGLNGIRKVGTCKGSWQCTNTSLFLFENREQTKPHGTLTTEVAVMHAIAVERMPSKYHVVQGN